MVKLHAAGHVLDHNIEEGFRLELTQAFAKTADHMRNREG